MGRVAGDGVAGGSPEDIEGGKERRSRGKPGRRRGRCWRAGSSTLEILHVYPQGGGDVSRFNPRGKITVKDSVAEGHLPFFGRAYSLPYGEGGGIEFDAPMKNPQVKTEKKKKKQSVTFSFSVPGKGDTYQITIETMGGDGCSVFLVSNNRTQISYSGKIRALEREGNKI